MQKLKRKFKMWTKSEIKTVATLWETSTVEELCKKLDITINQLNYIVTQMKKAGFKLAKKHKRSQVQSLLKEVLREMN